MLWILFLLLLQQVSAVPAVILPASTLSEIGAEIAPQLTKIDALSQSLPKWIKPHSMKPIHGTLDQTSIMSSRLADQHIQEICKRGASSSKACISPMKVLMQKIAQDLSPEMQEKLDLELISHDPAHFYDTMVTHPELLQAILNLKHHAAAEMIVETLKTAGSRNGNMALFQQILDHQHLVAFQTRVSHSRAELRLKIHHLEREGPTSHVMTLDNLEDLVEDVHEFSDEALIQLWNYLKQNSNLLVPHSTIHEEDIMREHASMPMNLPRHVEQRKVLHLSTGGKIVFSLNGREDPRLTNEFVTKAYVHSLNEMTQNILRNIFDEILKRGNTRTLNDIIQTDNFFNRIFPRPVDLYVAMTSDNHLASFMMDVENPEYIRKEWIPKVFSLASKEYHGNIALYKWMLNRKNFIDWQNPHHPRQGYTIGFKDLEKIRYDLSKDTVRETIEFLLRNKHEIKRGNPRHEVLHVIDFWIRKSYQYLHVEALKYIDINGFMTELLARAALPFWN